MKRDEKMTIKIPQFISDTIKTLENAGFEAYIVGGCVRDILMGIAPHDYDITTSALPHEIKSLFEKTIDTGIKHGTVTVIKENIPIEITTFRTEGAYSDNRRPDNIEFVKDLKKDLSRRDFTVNAICYNENVGFIDLFGGMEDIKNRTLKAVGNPEERYKEDALRILRLYRFAATLNFKIEKKTHNDALACSSLIKNVSRERIAEELKKAILGDNISALESLINTNAFDFISVHSCDNLENISNLQKNTDLRLFSLFSLCNCEIIKVAKELKLSNKTQTYFNIFLKLLSNKIPQNKYEIKQILSFCDFEIFEEFIEYLWKIKNINCNQIIFLLNEIKSNSEPYKISHLDISGNDIRQLGYKEIEIGNALNLVLQKVLEEPNLNKKETLIKILTK